MAAAEYYLNRDGRVGGAEDVSFSQPQGENYAHPKICFFHVLFKAGTEPHARPRGGSNTCSPGAASVISRIEALTAYENNWSPGGFQPSDEQTPAKEDLLKFAEVLNSCRPKSARRSLSYKSS